MKNLITNLQAAISLLLLIILLHSAKAFSQWTNTSAGFPSGTFALNSSVQGNNIYAGVNNGDLISDNKVSNLEFGISDLGFVSLKIYDLLDKEVAALVNEKLDPGTYQVEFDRSGVYFYRLAVGEFT